MRRGAGPSHPPDDPERRCAGAVGGGPWLAAAWVGSEGVILTCAGVWTGFSAGKEGALRKGAGASTAGNEGALRKGAGASTAGNEGALRKGAGGVEQPPGLASLTKGLALTLDCTAARSCKRRCCRSLARASLADISGTFEFDDCQAAPLNEAEDGIDGIRASLPETDGATGNEGVAGATGAPACAA